MKGAQSLRVFLIDGTNIKSDREPYFFPSKTLQVQQFKSGFDENKLRIRALENELLLTSKQLEEERSRQREMKRKVDEFEEAKGLKDQEYESKIKEVKGDVEELKSRLVEVTKYEIILVTSYSFL